MFKRKPKYDWVKEFEKLTGRLYRYKGVKPVKRK